MLRMLVMVLALANVGYFAWSQGLMAPMGLGLVNQSEAFRLNQQIRPEAIRLLPAVPNAAMPSALPTSQATEAPAVQAVPTISVAPTAAASIAAPGVSAAASTAPVTSGSASVAAVSPSTSATSAAVTANAAPAECLQAGVFTEAQADALRARLQASLPEGRWALNPAVEPARWIVYMGRYANEDMVTKKRSELRARGVRFEAVQNPALNPGLSLGHFETKVEADGELARDAERGVRTARVIQERAEQRGQRLVLPSVDTPLKTQLATLKPLLAGRAFAACR